MQVTDMSQICLMYVTDMSLIFTRYFPDVKGMYEICPRYFPGMSQKVTDMSQTCHKEVTDMSNICPRYVPDIFYYFTDMSQIYLLPRERFDDMDISKGQSNIIVSLAFTVVKLMFTYYVTYQRWFKYVCPLLPRPFRICWCFKYLKRVSK